MLARKYLIPLLNNYLQLILFSFILQFFVIRSKKVTFKRAVKQRWGIQSYYQLQFPGACSSWFFSVGLGNRLIDSMCTFGSFFKRVGFYIFQVGLHKLREGTKYISKVGMCSISVRNYWRPVTGVLCREKCMRKEVTPTNRHKWRQAFRILTVPFLSAVSDNSRFKP